MNSIQLMNLIQLIHCHTPLNQPQHMTQPQSMNEIHLMKASGGIYLLGGGGKPQILRKYVFGICR